MELFTYQKSTWTLTFCFCQILHLDREQHASISHNIFDDTYREVAATSRPATTEPTNYLIPISSTT